MVSIIVPVYNIEDYIDACVLSVTRQSYTDIEIILIDDGSTDSSSEKCDKWGQLDKRIHVIHKTNGGLSDARNKGIEYARGEYILFVDGDDYIHCSMIELLVTASEQYDADITCCDFQAVIGNVQYEKDFPINTDYRIHVYNNDQAMCCLDDVLVISCCKLFKKKIFSELRFPRGKLHEDEFMIHHFLYSAKKVVTLDIPLYYYVQRGGSIVHSIGMNNVKDAMDAYEDRINFINKHGWNAVKDGTFKIIFRYVLTIYNKTYERNMRRYIQNRFHQLVNDNPDVNFSTEMHMLAKGIWHYEIYKKSKMVQMLMKFWGG